VWVNKQNGDIFNGYWCDGLMQEGLVTKPNGAIYEAKYDQPADKLANRQFFE
jgi:hypothetical protein